MRIGLYSEIAQRRTSWRDVGSSPQRGFDATAADIRRQPSRNACSRCRRWRRFPDFYSISGCRDLLFHVQEHRFSIPQIREFVTARSYPSSALNCMPASFGITSRTHPADRAMTDLASWDAYERVHPETFAGMYQFWCQRGWYRNCDLPQASFARQLATRRHLQAHVANGPRGIT